MRSKFLEGAWGNLFPKRFPPKNPTKPSLFSTSRDLFPLTFDSIPMLWKEKADEEKSNGERDDFFGRKGKPQKGEICRADQDQRLDIKVHSNAKHQIRPPVCDHPCDQKADQKTPIQNEASNQFKTSEPPLFVCFFRAPHPPFCRFFASFIFIISCF